MEEILADPFHAARFGVEVVDWDVEEALDLRGVEVHRDDMVAAGGLEHVGHKLGCDRSAGLVFLVLSGVGKVGENGGDSAR